ncbi:MAG: DHHA1 domain-containing protein [Nitrospirae bacterium]|nr:DHHA1 domain-containing protein [Nitrospirota bacterium]MCL5285536.1 DHHA1 domain-containing protein [Nitrospirota bacterium]
MSSANTDPAIKSSVVPVTIFYHRNCSDGFGAAWAAWKRFSGKLPLSFVPYNYGDPLPEIPSDHDVFILDLSFDPDYLARLRKMARHLVLLDHHKSAMEKIQPLYPGDPDIVFDMNRSGAMIAWERFFPGEPVPNLIRYVEDRDLWRWSLPLSLEVTTAMASYAFDFDVWESLFRTLGYGTLSEDNPLVTEGRSILRYQSMLIKTAIRETGVWGRFSSGERAFFVNSPLLTSEIGGAMKSEIPFVVIWSVRKDGRISYSLRATEGGPDLSKIASRYGGGGHAKAAGFLADSPVHEVEGADGRLRPVIFGRSASGGTQDG